MTCLQVIFGTGPAGIATANALIGQGYEVQMVNQMGTRDPRLPAQVEVVAADAVSARRAAEGAQVIYNCLNTPYHQWLELFPALQSGLRRYHVESQAGGA